MLSTSISVNFPHDFFHLGGGGHIFSAKNSALYFERSYVNRGFFLQEEIIYALHSYSSTR